MNQVRLPACLLQLVVQQTENAVSRLGYFLLAVLVLDNDRAAVTVRLDQNLVTCSLLVLVLVLGGKDARKEATIILAIAIGILIDIPDKVDTLGTITIFNGKADPIQRQADTTPCTIKTFVDLDTRSCRRLQQSGTCLDTRRTGNSGFCLFLFGAQTEVSLEGPVSTSSAPR